MKHRLHRILWTYCAPAADDGTDLPGGDYGDDFTPTGDDAPTDRARQAEGEEGTEADDGGDEGGGEGAEDNALSAAADEVLEDGDEERESTGTPKHRGKFIPLDRHEKLLRKERTRREELEAQLSQSRSGEEMARVGDTMEAIEDELVRLEGQYNELLAEGQIKEATAVMTKIRHKNAELARADSAHRDAQVMAQAVERMRYDEALERVEEAYPELDSDHEDYDEDRAADVLDLAIAGQRRGLSPTKALQRAVQRIMGADTGRQRRATTVTPRVDESAVAAERKTAAVRRNLDAAGRTPPPTHKVGAGNDAAGGALTAKQVMAMSDEEFEKLTEKDLAKLRGDVL